MGGAPASRAQGDLWRVATATLLCYAVASAFELHESLFNWLSRYERWQADELPLTFTVFLAGLAWYAVRRRQDAQAELALRVRAEAQAGELLAHNRELAQQLIGVQESERLALARELHDELGQRCTAIRAETAFLRHCAADDRAGQLAAAGRADAAALDLYQGVRGLLRRLRPANLDSLGLEAALQELCAAWQERSVVACHWRPEGDLHSLGDAIDIAVYRITQEALTNVARHAQARRVWVRLACCSGPGELQLTVQDDGRGMDVTAATHGLGLLGAAERAAALGGQLHVHSTPGAGVQLALRIPTPLVPSACGAGSRGTP